MINLHNVLIEDFLVAKALEAYFFRWVGLKEEGIIVQIELAWGRGFAILILAVGGGAGGGFDGFYGFEEFGSVCFLHERISLTG